MFTTQKCRRCKLVALAKPNAKYKCKSKDLIAQEMWKLFHLQLNQKVKISMSEIVKYL